MYKIILISIAIFASSFAYAQTNRTDTTTYTLIGVVKDQNNESLPGATIYVKKHPSIGTSSDQFGNFVLKGIPKGDQTIIVSLIGMETREIVFRQQKSLVITLSDKSVNMKDVVVTGIYERNKNSFTGSATTYTKSELKMVGAQNLLQSLKTLEPAMQITDNNLRGSDPNTLPDIEIRGKTSVVGEMSSEYENIANQPLFILDGMEVELSTIVNLNIDRVASVTVLKDAASTAIYGSKSANGVIVVETVKPEPGLLRVAYNGTFSLQFPLLNDYNLMNASEKLQFEKLSGRYTYDPQQSSAASQESLDALYYSRLKSIREGVDTYWLADPLRTVLNNTHSLYLDGGDGAMQYGIGLNYGNENGIMKGSKRELMGGNINLVYRKGQFTFSNNFSIDIVNSEKESVSFDTFAKANPYYRKQNSDGTVPQLLESIDIAKETIYNPLYLYNIVNTDEGNDMALRNQFNATWRFLNSFQLRGRFGISKSISEQEAFKSPFHPDFIGMDADKKGMYSQNKNNTLNYNGDATLSFGKYLGDAHMINAIAGMSVSNRNTRKDGYIVSGFVGDDHRNPQFSSGFSQGDKPTYSNQTSRSAGFYVNGNYSFRNRYMMDASYRVDGSSVFGSQNMFTSTWSVGLGWNINNEKWFDVDWVDLLKLRFSIGNPGNQNFDAYISSGIYIYNPDYTNPFGESAIINKFQNKGLEWQKTLDQNYGIDFTLFEERLRISADYYYKNTDPLLVSITMPTSTGTTRMYTNFGGQIAKGYSGTINFIAIKTPSTRLGINLSLRHGSTKYVNIGNSLSFMNEGLSATTLRRYYDGASPDDMWAVRSMGIDPATGREVFMKKDGTYTFDYDASDEVVVGSQKPNLEGIIGTSFYYKQFSMAINFRYKFGGQVLASALYNKVENLSEADLYYNVDRRALYDRWQTPGDNAKFKAINLTETTPMSSRFVLDDDTFSCESISLGYETSGLWLRSIGAQGASIRLYMNNLFRISSVKEERGIEYPFSNSVSCSVGIRF